MKNLKLKISGMHCSSCALDVDGTLEDTQGVKKASTSYAKCECEVEFDEEKISDDKVIKIIETLGYKTS